jgi:hypothetical protein
MLYVQKLLAELEGAQERLVGYQGAYTGRLGAYRDALAALGTRYSSASALSAAQDARAAGQHSVVGLGARPTAEYDAWLQSGGSGVPVVPFGRDFAHHQEARAWAERLHGWVTVAVDGSQLLPWRDASLPVALVQAGIFENPHAPPAPYRKDVETELLLPDELLTEEPDTADARAGELLGYSTQLVHLRRFELEARTLITHMERYMREGRASRVVAFCDGSLIVSFAVKMQPVYRDRYVQAARHLLAASEACRIPLVGYIDTSYARDILAMLGSLERESGTLLGMRGLHDALLWQGCLGWGDRTPAFISARDDLARLGYGGQQEAVAFVYLQAALDRPPARLELPRWVLDDGRLDEVLDVVRAEVVAGNGYPYCIEAADAAAVISTADRAQFYALFQQVAERAGLTFSFSRKSLSKTRRRT